jgi:hypothetical protein
MNYRRPNGRADASAIHLRRRLVTGAAWMSLSSALLVSSPVHSAPSISSTSGSLNPGGTLTVTGSGFGSTGPKVLMFDDFERGSNGSPISFDAPIGQWDKANNTPVYTTTARSGRLGFLVYNTEQSLERQLQLDLGGNQSEIFISYWVRVPDGTMLMDTAQGHSDPAKYDMCIPTHIGRGVMYIAGNDFNFMQVGNSWWSWKSWMRVSTWYRNHSSNSGFFQVVSQEKGYSRLNFGSTSIFQGDTSRVFNRLNVPGWVRWGSDPNTRPAYDDVYVAVGRGAVARVELSDSSSYASSKSLVILPSTQWSDGRITASIPSGGTGLSGTVYLYVTDADGNTNQTGYRVNLTATSAIPKPPGSLTIN